MHISIIGAVRSGLAAAKLAKKAGAVPFVSELADYQKLQVNFNELEANGINYEYGGHTEQVYSADLIVTSPGVPSDSKVLQKALRHNIPIISELEFAYHFCKAKIIGITGTNGKTTATSLAAHMINQAGQKAYAAGNIGYAFSEIADDVSENEFVVLEISSFQLDYIKEFEPYISVILNITPDHLDRYDNNFDNYIQAKLNIQKNQDDSEYFVFNADSDAIEKRVRNKKVHRLTFSTESTVNDGSFLYGNKFYYSKDSSIEEVCATSDLNLKGKHNWSNALAVMTVGKLLGIDNSSISKAFSSFEGVEHRLELVRRIDGVDFINDSKATNVDSLWYALQSFDAPIILIMGGKDKGNDYKQIEELVKSNVKKIIAIGSSAGKISEYFKEIKDVKIVKTMEEAVKAALKSASENEVVLLSPACASFDMFDNFEHRGNVFKEIVSEL